MVHAITLKAALVMLTAFLSDAKRRVIATFPGLGRVFSDAGGAWSGLRWRMVIAALKACFRRHPRAKASFENEADRDVFGDFGIVAPENTVVLRGAGIDLARFAPRAESEQVPTGPPLVLFAGRLLRQKGVIAFIEAAEAYFGKVQAEGWPPARFAVAGAPDPGNRDSVDQACLDALAASRGVVLLGRIADMPALLRETDLLCLPTRYGEGLPRILLETAACAVPAVASDLAGCRAVTVDGKTGLLVPPDDPEALLTALHDLIAEPALRARMGREARKRVEEGGFDEETIARAFLALYRGGRGGLRAESDAHRPAVTTAATKKAKYGAASE